MSYDPSVDLCNRSSLTMFHTVEIGIGIGGFAGAKYMAGHGVPFDVARRVLLKPGQRRSAKW